MLVRSLDRALRSYYAIAEFSEDPRCVLRLGRSTAGDDVVLGDGVAVYAGDPVGTVHLWNEHLPPFRNRGPDIGWGVEIRRRVEFSLRELARFIERDPQWAEVRAFRAEAALSSRLGRLQLCRVARRCGFECIRERESWMRQLHAIGDCFNGWGLTRVYNPGALQRQRFFRPYHCLWRSRESLIAHYGEAASPRQR